MNLWGEGDTDDPSTLNETRLTATVDTDRWDDGSVKGRARGRISTDMAVEEKNTALVRSKSSRRRNHDRTRILSGEEESLHVNCKYYYYYYHLLLFKYSATVARDLRIR